MGSRRTVTGRADTRRSDRNPAESTHMVTIGCRPTDEPAGETSSGTTDPAEIQRVLDAIHGVVADIGMDDEFSVGLTLEAGTYPRAGARRRRPALAKTSRDDDNAAT